MDEKLINKTASMEPPIVNINVYRSLFTSPSQKHVWESPSYYSKNVFGLQKFENFKLYRIGNISNPTIAPLAYTFVDTFRRLQKFIKSRSWRLRTKF